MMDYYWNHILIEGHCSFNDKLENTPKHCKSGVGNVGLQCVKSSTGGLCKYLDYTSARSSVVLTDQKGECVKYDGFHSPENDETEFLKKEKGWLEKWIGIFNENVF